MSTSELTKKLSELTGKTQDAIIEEMNKEMKAGEIRKLKKALKEAMNDKPAEEKPKASKKKKKESSAPTEVKVINFD